jgi:hypothetical protein
MSYSKGCEIIVNAKPPKLPAIQSVINELIKLGSIIK